jgi:hypothetical protein
MIDFMKFCGILLGFCVILRDSTDSIRFYDNEDYEDSGEILT